MSMIDGLIWIVMDMNCRKEAQCLFNISIDFTISDDFLP